jgi:hypothetical protein
MIRRCVWLLLVAPLIEQLPGQAPSQVVYRAPSAITIDAKLDDAAWQTVPVFSEFHFNDWVSGEKELTDARMLWDDQNLYVAYYCHDKHISAHVTARHGAVSRDDCVEIFISPNPEKVHNYYTFEINAIGAMLNRCRTDWWHGAPTWEPEGVDYKTSYYGSAGKDEAPDDDHWIVELAIPFRNFSHDAAHTPPHDGDEWRLNLHRTGGVTNKQNSSWSPILPPNLGFHSPDAFGTVRFVSRAAK